MKAHELNVDGKKDRIRPGRGISAGRGKTAGRGTKGQSARAGGKRRPGFEGGQNPFSQRLPKKRGFTSHRTPKQTIYTGQLDSLGATVSNQTLVEAGLIDDMYNDVKVVLKGDVTKKHTVELAGASTGAIAAIEKAGGSYKEVASPNREKQTSTK